MSQSAYAVGETNITLYCRFSFFFSNYYNNLTFEFRPNKNYDWLDVGYINESGTYRMQKQSKENFISFMYFYGYLSPFYNYLYLRAHTTVSYNRCIVDDELYPSFRCRGSMINGSVDTSPEKNILSIKGNTYFVHKFIPYLLFRRVVFIIKYHYIRYIELSTY